MKSIFHPNYYIHSVLHINKDFIDYIGAKVLVLDIDNTLTEHDMPITDEIKSWIFETQKAGTMLCIASNNTAERVELFNRQLGLSAFSKANKPLPFVFNRVEKRFNVKRNDIALVGDQIFTDILCGSLGRVKTILVDPVSPNETNFIKFKRKIEKLVVNRQKLKISQIKNIYKNS